MGCENFGRIADIVYHEFGHAIHEHAIIPPVLIGKPSPSASRKQVAITELSSTMPLQLLSIPSQYSVAPV